MEDYVNALSAMSVSISEEGLLDAADGVGRADSSMSAPPPVPRKAARNKQANFSAYEDNILCKAWLEISCDAAINTGQRRESFWLRVVNRYKSCCSARKYPERSQKSIMSRWDFIKTEGVEGHNFTLMHCWQILKDEPKWMDLKSKMDTPQNSASSAPPLNLNLAPVDPSAASSAGKRPMGRDAAKAAKKAAGSSEYASKMHDLTAQKIELFKDTKIERKVRHDEIVALEKVKVEEAREHRKLVLELEKKRLDMEEKRLQMEAEKKEKKEDERILAINLDHCQPIQRLYYQGLQEDILQKMMARRRGPSQ
ncbi:unnamed protein product [Urochloa decumbens]|uniref:No apical meristem-associated C-terminal domain-containing protein n=1 Tax=Urochloa decumbens TaxID=240449 RepID=A0ABC9D0W8_9POAL